MFYKEEIFIGKRGVLVGCLDSLSSHEIERETDTVYYKNIQIIDVSNQSPISGHDWKNFY